MQLSTSLLPLDLPAANAGGAPVGTSMPIPGEAPADFSALLQAESTPLATTPRASDPIFATPMPVALDDPSEFPLTDEQPQQQQTDDKTPDAMPEVAPDLHAQPLPRAIIASPGIKPDAGDTRDAAGADSEPNMASGGAAEMGRTFSPQIVPHTPRGDAVHPRQGGRAVVEAANDAARPIRADLASPRENPSRATSRRAPSSDSVPTVAVETPLPRFPVAGREIVSRETAHAPAANPNISLAIDRKSGVAEEGDVKRASEVTPASTPSRQNDSDALTARTQVPEQATHGSAEARTSASKISTPILAADHPRTAPMSANSAQVESRASRGASEASQSPASPTAATSDVESLARIEKLETAAATGATQATAVPSNRARVLEAKFAVGSPRPMQSPASAYKFPEKMTQTTDLERINDEPSSFGTNVAKPEAHMPAAVSLPPSAPSAVERLSQAVAPLSFEFSPGEEPSEHVELAQAARRAVNAAVAVTEQFAADRKPAVTLKFTVSGVDLGVHVELRGENVHTTFRTDSPELRAALAQEWNQVAAAQAGDRASRLAEPVFTSNHNASSVSSQSNGSSQPDFGAADQRSFQQRQEHAAASEWARFRAASRASDASSTPAAVVAPAARATVSESSSRLRTFA